MRLYLAAKFPCLDGDISTLYLVALICVTFAVQLSLVNHTMERKTDTLNLRVTPELKELIRLAAEREHRTIANFIDVLVREHCAENGIAIPVKQPQSH